MFTLCNPKWCPFRSSVLDLAAVVPCGGRAAHAFEPVVVPGGKPGTGLLSRPAKTVARVGFGGFT